MKLPPKHNPPSEPPPAWRVEPTPADQVEPALALIVGAGRSGPDVSAGVAALRGYLADDMPPGHMLWWAHENARPVAAALAVQSPGRTAVLLYSTTDTGLISVDPLADLLDATAQRFLSSGSMLVQALLSPASVSDIRAFEQAGFFLLAELIYMRQCLRGRHVEHPDVADRLTYRHYAPETHDLFARTILASYADSLDCPALEGLRDIEDILAGHKAAGVFRPDLWTVALLDGEAAGVLLMNQNATQNVAEIIYMGVAKPYRGQHIGRALLAKAAEAAGADRFGAISLAVDAGNRYAHALYVNEGFVEASRRLAYVRTSRSDR